MPICLPRHLVFSFVGLVLLTPPALSHEFWIEPQEYQVERGASVVASLRNGENFGGFELVYLPKRVNRFAFSQNYTTTEYRGRMGDTPAFSHAIASIGLFTILHETKPELILYEKWEEFETFSHLKGFAKIKERHQDRDLPNQGFAEMYSRHAKTLISIEDGFGADVLHGMEVEIVALANPYTDDLSKGLRVQLFYQNQPRVEARITVYERTATGEVSMSSYVTDAQGVARLSVKPGNTYLLDAVILRPAPADIDAVWETLWASMTFATPN